MVVSRPIATPYDDAVRQEAVRRGVDPNFAVAVMHQESAGNPHAVSGAGAEGLMQLMPATAAGLGVSNPLDSAQNIRGGVNYLSQGVQAYNGNYANAAARYNAGPKTSHWGNPETTNYVNDVASRYMALTADSGDPAKIAESAAKFYPAKGKAVGNQAVDTSALDSLFAQPSVGTPSPTGASPSAPAQPQKVDTSALDSLFATPAKPTPKPVPKTIAGTPDLTKSPSLLNDFGVGLEDVTRGAQNLVASGAQRVGNLLGSAGWTGGQNALSGAANAIRANANNPQAVADASMAEPGIGGQLARGAGQMVAAAPLTIGGAELAGAGLAGAGEAVGGPIGSALRVAGNAVTGTGGGNILTKGAALATGGAVQGAGFNALTGRPIGQGAELGAVAGPALGAAGALIKGGGGAIVNALRSPENNAVKQTFAALQADGYTPEAAIAKMQSMGSDATLADVGQNARRLADASTVSGGPAAQQGGEVMAQRAEERFGRMGDAITKATGQGSDVHGTLDNLIAQRSAEAAPLYDQAFAGGSMAPLEGQFQKEWQALGQQEADAQKAIVSAKAAFTGQKGDQATIGGNVYADQATKGSAEAAQSKVAAAEKNLADIQAQKQAALERMQKAQADGTANAPGAVWNPRIEQFVNDPIMEQGLKRGLAIQRIESVAEGKPFNPSEYAIVGTDASGDPIVGTVPNMRTLDAGKRGLDALIADHTDPVTGKVDEYGRAVTKFKNAYVSQLDKINPDYAAARQAWSGPSAAMDAVNLGRRAFKNDPEVTAKIVSKLPDSQKEFYLQGVTRALMDDVGTNPKSSIGKILRNRVLQEKIKAALPSDASYQDFMRAVENEGEKLKTENLINKGSPTEPRRVDQAKMQAAASHALNAVRDIYHGNVAGGVVNLGRGIMSAGGSEPPSTEALGNLLFSQDPRYVTNQLMPNLTPRQEALSRLGKGANALTSLGGKVIRDYGAQSALTRRQ